LNYRIEDIPAEGLTIDGEQNEQWLSGLFSTQEKVEFSFISPLRYQVYLSRSGSLVLVKGALHLTIQLACSRCLEPFPFALAPEFSFSLRPGVPGKPGQERELMREELDTDFYHGDVVDLGLILQNQIMLSVPFRALCGEDCRGLCPRCGTNRNKETCQCGEQEGGSSKFSVLKDFFKNN
jgi:uncharacterized protein